MVKIKDYTDKIRSISGRNNRKGRGGVFWHTYYDEQTLSLFTHTKYTHVFNVISNPRTVLFEYNSVSKWKQR